MGKTVYSIEPISKESSDMIERELCCRYCYIERQIFLKKIEMHKDISVLICRDRDAVSEIIDYCPSLKFLFIVSTGVEKLPFKKLQERGIAVANTGGVNAPIMSEYAMAYILSQSARVCENLRNQMGNIWKKFQCVESLENKYLLIVGAGRTGRLLAAKAKAFGMKVVGIKRCVSNQENFDLIASLEDLDLYLSNADYVVLTIPSTSETKYLFDYARFKKMKKNAVFINISRGSLVNERDLVNALKDRLIGCAILDVFENEPLPPSSEMWQMDNLIITPHSSGRLTDFMDRAMRCFVNNMKAFEKNESLPNKVDLNAGY